MQITDAVKKQLHNFSIGQFTRIYQSFLFLPDNVITYRKLHVFML